MVEGNKKLNIAVIAQGFLGDTLLVEPLCRNIKRVFPDCNLIFIVSKVFADVPKGFESVDEIIEFDKKNHNKGLIGYWNFYKECKYKGEIDIAIITHPHERSLFISHLMGVKRIISKPIRLSLLNLLITDKISYPNEKGCSIYQGDFYTSHIKPFAQPEYLPVRYKRDDLNEVSILEKFSLPTEYIVLSPTSKVKLKDWDYNNISKFIINSNLPVVLVGTELAHSIGKQLIKDEIDFIDLTNLTTISELGVIIKNSKICVSMDTGTLHFAYAQGVKSIGIFFEEEQCKTWTPKNLECLKILLGKKSVIKDEIVTIKNINYDEVLNEIDKVLYKSHDKIKS